MTDKLASIIVGVDTDTGTLTEDAWLQDIVDDLNGNVERDVGVGVYRVSMPADNVAMLRDKDRIVSIRWVDTYA